VLKQAPNRAFRHPLLYCGLLPFSEQGPLTILLTWNSVRFRSLFSPTLDTPFQPQKEEQEQPLPDGPITVGIDGGYVRATPEEGWFEVIAGRSVVAFRRAEGEEVPPAKCFGFVQPYDEKPRRRLWELLKSQGMQEN
jgi:hypothetical protein